MHAGDLTKILIFYGVALGLAVVLAVGGGLTDTTTYMLAPLAGVIVALLATGNFRHRSAWAGLGLHRPGLAALPLAVLVPVAVVGAGFAIALATGSLAFAVPADVFGMPLDALVWALPLALVLNTLTWSLAEEIGWRGYLLPRLAALGTMRALILSGFLWGLWHLPLLFFTTLYHAGENLAVFVPLFLAAATAAGVFIGALRLSTASVWPAALAHSAHNLSVAVFTAFVIGASPEASLIAGEAALSTIAGYGFAGLLLVRHLGRPSAPSYPAPTALAHVG